MTGGPQEARDDRGGAFGGPAARASRDRILLLDHVVATEVGAFGAERGLPQRLRFDVAAEVAPTGDDDVDAVLSYDRLAEAVAAALAEGRADLLETLAERVAQRVLREPRAARAFVRVAKLDRGPGELAVEIARDRSDAIGSGPAPDPLPPPRVLALGGPLPAALPPGAVLACVGAPGLPVPAAQGAAARRIALLACDQAAWAAASRLGAHAVSTRTEMDWAARRRLPAVWAPARLMADAEGPATLDAPSLAAWIAPRLGASWEAP